MFQEIFKNMKPIDEGGFQYFEVDKIFDVSVNFIKAGEKIPFHTHDQEVFNYVFEGHFVVNLNGNHKEYTKGEWINIPANLSHAVETKTAVTLLELWRK